MKKSCKALAILLVAVTMSTGVMAAEEVNIQISDTTTTSVARETNYRGPNISKGILKINDIKIDLSQTPLLEVEGHFYLPMRKIATALGVKGESILWNPATKEATLDMPGFKFVYNTVTNETKLNSNKYESDSSVFVTYEGSVYMKVRFMCTFLGGGIAWDSSTQALNIYKKGIEIPQEMVYVEPAVVQPVKKGRSYTAEELDLLARIVEAEAKDQPYEGRVAVANVILNRVDSAEFPDTIEAVVYQKNQFTPVRTGSVNKKASELSVQAAKEALEGREVTDALFFNATWVKWSWASRNREYCMKLGTHVFYY